MSVVSSIYEWKGVSYYDLVNIVTPLPSKSAA